MSADGTSVDEIPVSSLFAPLYVPDIAARAAKGATLVTGAPKVNGGTGGPERIFAMV